MIQFNAAHALQTYVAAREGRLNEQMREQQLSTARQQMDRQRGIQAAFRAYSGQSVPEAAMPPGFGGAPNAAPVVGQDASGATIPMPTDAPARNPAAGNRQQLFETLLTLDPEQAFNVSRAFSQMDEATAAQTMRLNQVIGRGAADLLSVPFEQRQARLDAIAPGLIESGVREERIATVRANPSDQNLRAIMNEGRDLEKVFESTRPDIVFNDNFAFDRNAADPTRPIAQSPRTRLVTGPRGEVWEEGPVPGIPQYGQAQTPQPQQAAPVRVNTPEEARRLAPGTLIEIPGGRILRVPGGPGASPASFQSNEFIDRNAAGGW